MGGGDRLNINVRFYGNPIHNGDYVSHHFTEGGLFVWIRSINNPQLTYTEKYFKAHCKTCCQGVYPIDLCFISSSSSLPAAKLVTGQLCLHSERRGCRSESPTRSLHLPSRLLPFNRGISVAGPDSVSLLTSAADAAHLPQPGFDELNRDYSARARAMHPLLIPSSATHSQVHFNPCTNLPFHVSQ